MEPTSAGFTNLISTRSLTSPLSNQKNSNPNSAQSIMISALLDNSNASLRCPSQQYLRRRLVVLFVNGKDLGVLDERWD